MSFPKFFEEVPTIVTYDPLALMLGTVEEGIIKFKYTQIVKSAGHSCPTIAGAYLMTYKALKALYPDSLPVRGEIKVEFKGSIESGVTGVISNVVSNITGATEKSGFKGLNGKFSRHSLMSFNATISNMIRFTRLDTNKSVEVSYNPDVVPSSKKVGELMQLIMAGKATSDEVKTFGSLWQERVKKILIDNQNNDEMIHVV